jgi:quinol monooxygenase YgiN
VHKFIITLQLKPGTRDAILARVPEAQAATWAEPGCIAYDFFTCTDDPDRLVFVEAWTSKEAHDWHLCQEHTRAFIAFHEPKHRSFRFETVNAEA